MKKDWLAAIFAFPSIMLEMITGAIKQFAWEEKEALEGGEYDEEADYQQGAETQDS